MQEKGEAAKDENDRIYLLRLDDYQLERIARENYPLLKKLAVLGCIEAGLMVVNLTRDIELLKILQAKGSAEVARKAEIKVSFLETIVQDSETANRFLWQFFLFACFRNENKCSEIQNIPVQDSETNVQDSETLYKDLNGNGLNPMGMEESGNSPSENSPHAPDDLSTESLPAGKPTNAALKKPRSSAGKPADVRIDHPAVKMVKEITGRFPKKTNWDRLIREIGEDPDIEFFRKCFEIWTSFDGNELNLDQWIFLPNEEKKPPERFERKSKKASDNGWKTIGKSETFPHISNREAEPEERDLLLPNLRELALDQAIDYKTRNDVYALVEMEQELHPEDWQWIQTQLKILEKTGA